MLKKLFNHRELLLFFIWRDILVRYKQAFLGIFWALIRPLLNLGLFVFVFQKIALLETHSPYPLFVLAGLLPWQLIASVLQSSSMSLIQNQVLIQKTSFPRIFLPMSSVVVNALDFLLGLLFFLSLTAIFHHLVIDQAVYFVFFLFLLTLLSLGISFWCSAIAVRFKDLVIAIPYLVQVGIFVTPVGYPTDAIPFPLSLIFLLNPLSGVIDGFRWSILGEQSTLMPLSIPYSIVATLLIYFMGLKFFKKVEIDVADQI